MGYLHWVILLIHCFAKQVKMLIQQLNKLGGERLLILCRNVMLTMKTEAEGWFDKVLNQLSDTDPMAGSTSPVQLQ